MSTTELRPSGPELINTEKSIGITSCVQWVIPASICLFLKTQRQERSLDETAVISIVDYVVAVTSLQI